MAGNDPWAAFNPQPAPNSGGLDVVPLPKVPEPKSTYRVLAPQEVTQRGLNPTHSYQVSSEGEVKDLGELPPSAAPAAPNRERAVQIQTILQDLKGARDLARKPFATGSLAGNSYFQGVPIIGQNAADLAGALNMAQGDLIQQARKDAAAQGINIGATQSNTEKEAARLAASIANLDQSQSFDQLATGIDRAEQYYRRALAREQGLNPDDPNVQAKLGIRPVENDAEQQSAMDQPDAAPPTLSISTKNQYVAPTPEQQAAGQKIGAMLAKGLPLANIQMFAKNNGLDYLNSNIAEIHAQRLNPKSTVAKWFKQNPGKPYPVDVGGYNAPLTDGEQQAAEVSGSPGGAFLASAGDVGSFGVAPEVAGAVGLLTGNGYGAGRQDFIRKQEMLSSEHPIATFLGGLTGGATSLAPMKAPISLPQLIRQGATYGGVHGFASSEDPSLGGRFGNAAIEAATGAVAAPVVDLGLRGVAKGGTGLGRFVRRMTGGDPEQLANEAALSTLVGRMPEQDLAAARAKAAEQTSLGANPSAATTMDRAGQDYLGRIAQTSPQAREAADAAVAKAEQGMPAAIRDDFTQAIDAAAGDKDVSAFLNRPAREITSDVQDMAGREFEGAVKPIYHEPVQLNDELLTVLTDEQAPAAIRDALRQPGITPETKAILRALPQRLKAAESVMDTSATTGLGSHAAQQVAAAQQQARDAVLNDTGLNVEAMWRIRSAMQRRARKMADGEPAAISLSDLAKTIGDNVGDAYPEWADANQLYASRMRAIDALDNARQSFLNDTDAVAKQATRNSAKRGEPGPNGEKIPSEQEMAQTGAREAATEAAGTNARGSAQRVATDLSGVNQQERNALLFGKDAAANIEARTGAKAQNLETLKRVQSGGRNDANDTKQRNIYGMATNLFRGWAGAAAVDLVRNVKGISPEEAGRIVTLYTTPGKQDELLASLEKQYGRRKARFVMSRIGVIASTAQSTRAKPKAAD